MKITKEELTILLDEHKKWLEGKGGCRANLSDANLSDANLSDADLGRANLSDANLSDANLSGADLSDANLSGADLRRANLSGADLRRANLSDADLGRANLRRADLSDANLRRADLSGADLSGAVGVSWADCSFSGHGEIGRRLLVVRIGSNNVYFCGCFSGSREDLEQYIMNGDQKYAESRTFAMEFVTKAINMEKAE